MTESFDAAATLVSPEVLGNDYTLDSDFSFGIPLADAFSAVEFPRP